MAVKHGLLGVVKSGANTISSIIGYKASTKTDFASKAVMGDTWDSFLAGLSTGSISLETLYEPGDTTGQEAVTQGAALTLNLYPQGTTTGNKFLAVAVLVESIDVDGKLNSPVGRAYTFRINAQPTWSAAP